MKKKLIILLASGFYSGYAPFASGTFGTLVGILIFIPFCFLSPLAYLVLLILLTFFSFWVSGEAEKIFQKKDSGVIVIDEIVGYLVTMFLIPVSLANQHDVIHNFLPKVILGFFLFRLTDIVKFPPARFIDQKLTGGKGVVWMML